MRATFAAFGAALWSMCAPSAEAQCPPSEVAKLTAPYPSAYAAFGTSSAISGDTLIVGDPNDSQTARFSGVVHVFRRTRAGAQAWIPVAQLKASDAHVGQNLGMYVALDDNTIAVGSPLDSSLGLRAAGAIYVFNRSGVMSDDWVQAAKLFASDPVETALFGQSLAVSGSTIAVGAPWAKPRDVRTGAVYCFEQIATSTGRAWRETQQLVPTAQKELLEFGLTLALSEGILATGAPNDDSAILQAGAVHAFGKANGRWILDAVITAPDAAVNDVFGAVALSDDRLFIGAVGDDDQGPSSGSLYVFERNRPGWVFEQKLLPLEGEGGDNFGASIAAEGDFLVATARLSSAQAADAGIAHTFRRTVDGSWQPAGALVPSAIGPQNKMQDVSLCEGVVVLGFTSFLSGGAVHVFDTRLNRTTSTYCGASPAAWPECEPAIEAFGNATASGTSEFTLRAEQVPAGLFGFFAYTYAPTSLPIDGSARTCLPGGALGRSQLLFSNGTFGGCDGFFELDWNDVLAAQAGGDPALVEPGTFVYGQFAFFGFTPGGPMGFSDAVAFVTCP
jgi:hypothetical protein